MDTENFVHYQEYTLVKLFRCEQTIMTRFATSEIWAVFVFGFKHNVERWWKVCYQAGVFTQNIHDNVLYFTLESRYRSMQIVKALSTLRTGN